jgi:hypothetical protein
MARDEYRMSRSIVYGYAAPLTNDMEWFWYAPGAFLLSAIQVVRYGLFCGDLRAIARSLSWPGKALLLLGSPLAIALLARDYASGRIANQCKRLEQVSRA